MIFDAKDLEYCLRRWGRVFGEPKPVDEDEDEDAEIHVSERLRTILAEALDFGLATKRTKEAPFRRNRSRARLEICGRTLESGTIEPAPTWGPDPIRSVRQSNSGGSPRVTDPIAEVIERSVSALYRFDRMLGVCVRVEYCVRARFRERVARAGFHLELKLPAREYRRAVDRARVWLAGRLTTLDFED